MKRTAFLLITLTLLLLPGCGGSFNPPNHSSDYLPNYLSSVTTPRFECKETPCEKVAIITYKIAMRDIWIHNSEGTADDALWQWKEALRGVVELRRVYGDTPAMWDISFGRTSDTDDHLGLTFADVVAPNGFTPRHVQTYIADTIKSPTELENTVLHEAGHLVIRGHSPNEEDVMFPTIRKASVKRITPSDINTFAYAFRKR